MLSKIYNFDDKSWGVMRNSQQQYYKLFCIISEMYIFLNWWPTSYGRSHWLIVESKCDNNIEVWLGRTFSCKPFSLQMPATFLFNWTEQELMLLHDPIKSAASAHSCHSQYRACLGVWELFDYLTATDWNWWLILNAGQLFLFH